MEAEATFTVQQVAATAVMLYLCMFRAFLPGIFLLMDILALKY